MPEKPSDGYGEDLRLDGMLGGGWVSVLSEEPQREKGALGFLAAMERRERRERPPMFRMLEH